MRGKWSKSKARIPVDAKPHATIQELGEALRNMSWQALADMWSKAGDEVERNHVARLVEARRVDARFTTEKHAPIVLSKGPLIEYDTPTNVDSFVGSVREWLTPPRGTQRPQARFSWAHLHRQWDKTIQAGDEKAKDHIARVIVDAAQAHAAWTHAAWTPDDELLIEHARKHMNTRALFVDPKARILAPNGRRIRK